VRDSSLHTSRRAYAAHALFIEDLMTEPQLITLAAAKHL